METPEEEPPGTYVRGIRKFVFSKGGSHEDTVCPPIESLGSNPPGT